MVDAREVDAEVAEKVFGLKVVHFGTIADFEFRQRDSACKVPSERIIYADSVPRYTTDPAADYAVFCHARDRRAWTPFVAALESLWKSRLPVGASEVHLLMEYKVGDYARAALGIGG